MSAELLGIVTVHPAGHRAPRLPLRAGIIGRVANDVEPAFEDTCRWDIRARFSDTLAAPDRAFGAIWTSQMPRVWGFATRLLTDEWYLS